MDSGLGHKVVLHVQHALAPGSHIGQQPLRHQLAVATRKLQGRTMLRQVGCRLWRACLQATVAKGIHMLSQDALPHAARAGVHHKQQVPLVNAQVGQRVGLVDRVHLLKLCKVVSAADGAQRRLVSSGVNASLSHGLRHGVRVLHRAVDIAHPLFQLVELHRAGAQVGLPQRHAAANVIAHQGGVKLVA